MRALRLAMCLYLAFGAVGLRAQSTSCSPPSQQQFDKEFNRLKGQGMSDDEIKTYMVEKGIYKEYIDCQHSHPQPSKICLDKEGAVTMSKNAGHPVQQCLFFPAPRRLYIGERIKATNQENLSCDNYGNCSAIGTTKTRNISLEATKGFKDRCADLVVTNNREIA